jgi:hypothetical protein
MLCYFLKVSHHFRGICCLQLQGWKVSQAGSKEAWLFEPEDVDVLLNVRGLSTDYIALYPRRKTFSS